MCVCVCVCCVCACERELCCVQEVWGVFHGTILRVSGQEESFKSSGARRWWRLLRRNSKHPEEITVGSTQHWSCRGGEMQGAGMVWVAEVLHHRPLQQPEGRLEPGKSRGGAKQGIREGGHLSVVPRCTLRRPPPRIPPNQKLLTRFPVITIHSFTHP